MGIYDDAKALFGDFDKGFTKNLEECHFTKLRGYFLATAFLLILGVGLYISFGFPSTTTFNFWTDVVVFSFIAAVVIYPIFGYVFIPIYCAFFKTMKAAKPALATQIIGLFISIVLTFSLNSSIFLLGGFLVFAILLFIYPLTRIIYGNQKIGNLNKTLQAVYAVLVFMINLVSIIIKLAKL